MSRPIPTSTVSDVLKIFWKSLRLYKVRFALIIVTLASTSVFQLLTPLLYKRFFDILGASETLDRTNMRSELVHVILMVLLINILLWIAYRSGTFLVNDVSSRVMARLKQQAFEHMIDHSYGFYSNNFTGSLVQRVNRLANAYDRLFDRLVFNIVPMTILIIGSCIVLWRIRPILTLIIVALTISFASFNYFFSRFKLKYDVAVAEADSKTTGLLSDDISNQNTVQLFTSAHYESALFTTATNHQAAITRFRWNLSGVVDAVQSSLIFIVEFVIFYFAIGYWTAGAITIGTFILIQVYFINLGSRLWEFSRIIRDVYEGFANAKEMVDIMLLPHEVKNIPSAKELRIITGSIYFDKVSFSFNQTRQVLSKLSVSIIGGQKIALIGPSGAGKSTFIRLILRLYDLESGHIKIDSQDIKDVTQESLRKNISLVPQDPILFHRTLMENIRYGRKEASDGEVYAAAQQAHCDEFVQELPLKYETLVGERGIKLSGGERQRIAIARAILKNAPILILDEATSSLDSESEALIQDALDTLMKGKTTIVIAHRLSTIRKMDRIIVMQDGTIVEDNTHDELLKNPDSLYGKLWKLQAGGFIA